MNYTIVVPCFNEEDSLLSTIADIRASLAKIPIVLIDDGSTDRTFEIAMAIPDNVTIIKHPINLGYGSAVQTGIKFSYRKGYDAVILFDADGQHSANDIIKAISFIKNREADVVIGSRFLGSHTYKIPFLRKAGILAFRLLLNALSRSSITDPTTGFQALNRKAMRICISDDFSTDFPDADMLLMYKRSGLRIKEIPAHFKERTAGVSMHTYLKGFYYTYKVTLSMCMVAIRRYPRIDD